MLNNKGFAVSTVLYTLLIAFLMFLGVALAQFSSASLSISKVNDDLINGTRFTAVQVKKVDANNCQWQNNTMVKISSKYGTIYWPKDFQGEEITINVDGISISGGTKSTNGKIMVSANANVLTFIQDNDNKNAKKVTIENICK